MAPSFFVTMHVLGIDAGGTKTVCQLADATGAVLAEARSTGANLQAVGELQVEKVLHEVMEEAIGERDVARFFEPLPPEEEWRPFDF